MQINNISAEHINNSKKVSYKRINGREVLRTLANPDSLATTVVLESFVTGGRGINAYKRGGSNEFRERFTDDVVSAVFWMKGVDIFNKIGDKIGKKVLKLPTTEFDVGKDALRTPFKNLESNIAKTAKDSDAAQKMAKKLATFKFTKILTSSLLATAFVGFALPKINQAITERIMGRHKMEDKMDKGVEIKSPSLDSDFMNNHSFEAFDKKISSYKNSTSFKGISTEAIATIAHTLENHKIAKMLTTDVGILTGRVSTARNADEAREYLFRDSLSPFFYYASTPLIYKGLQHLTKSVGLTNIDPVAAKQVHKVMVEQLTSAGAESMPVQQFAAKTLGTLSDKAKDVLGKLPFNSDVVSLKDFCKQVTDKGIRKTAAQMSKLQPVQAGVGRVLTKQQVTDVLASGSLHSPEFMQSVYGSKFGKALTDKFKFIPMKKITSFHDNIEKYAQSVINAANKTNGGIVDKKLLDKVNKKSFAMSAGFRIIATGISAITLGFIIPKLQYAMTAKRTGSNAAPGLRKYEEEQKA